MARGFTQGDLERALLLLPEPIFRARDIYPVAGELYGDRTRGNPLWMKLCQLGLIVRTSKRIGRYTNRFYWERTPGTPHAPLNA